MHEFLYFIFTLIISDNSIIEDINLAVSPIKAKTALKLRVATPWLFFKLARKILTFYTWADVKEFFKPFLIWYVFYFPNGF